MDKEIENFAYMMAAEKMVTMLQTMSNTMEFMDEYKIKPDEEVKKALLPVLERIKKWAESK